MIGSFKAGLPPSIGLRDSIDMISERFRWTGGKMVLMILMSSLYNILGIVFYGFDFYSDFMFSKDLLEKDDNCSGIYVYLDDFKKGMPGNCSQWIYYLEGFKRGMPENVTFLKNFVSLTRNLSNVLKNANNEAKQCNNDSDKTYETLGLITMVHCFIPFLFIILIFCRMILKDNDNNYKKYWRIPLPIITNFYNIYLAYKCHRARAAKDFKEKIVSVEEKIKDHEKSVVLALVIEAATEASFQFFIQTLYLMPKLVADTNSMRFM